MAEGGYDPETTNPFDPHGDDDDQEETSDKTPLIPKGTEMKHPQLPNFGLPPGYKPPVTKTSTSKQSETSFIDDTTSGKVYISNRELEKEEIERRIKAIFHKPATSMFFSRIDGNDRVMIRLNRTNAIEYELLNSREELAINLEKLPKTLRNFLGKTHVEINQENYEKQLEEEQKQAERKSKHENAMREEAKNKE